MGTVATHLHTISLASALVLQFHALVASPADTLSHTLPLLAAAQGTYLALASSTTPSFTPSSSSSSDVPMATKKKKRKTQQFPGTQLLLSMAFSLAVGAPLLYAILVLFGAPLTTHLHETALTAAHMSLLACFPLVFNLGVDGQRWKDAVSCSAAINEAFLGALGACVGAWAGAVPIPLGTPLPCTSFPSSFLFPREESANDDCATNQIGIASGRSGQLRF